MSEKKKIKEISKIKEKNKIASIDIRPEDLMDPEMDETLRQEVMQAADELEASLNSDPKLMGAGVSDDLFLSIVGKLKEQGVWEEEAETEEEAKTEEEAETGEEVETGEEAETEEEMSGESMRKNAEEKRTPEELADIYSLLPEEDLKALQLGRQMQRQEKQKAHKKKKRRKLYHVAGAAAAMLVLVCGLGMSTEANRKVALQAWNAVMENFGFRTYTDYVDEEFTVRSKSKEEVAAFEEMQDALQLKGIDFPYMPEGMEFLDYVYVPETWEADLFYEYNGYIVNIHIINTEKESVTYYSKDEEATLRDTFTNTQNVKMEIWENNVEDLEVKPYVGKTEFDACRCIISGVVSEDELQKIMKWMIFL